jgi:hypothetical protein
MDQLQGNFEEGYRKIATFKRLEDAIAEAKGIQRRRLRSVIPSRNGMAWEIPDWQMTQQENSLGTGLRRSENRTVRNKHRNGIALHKSLQ